MKKRAVIILSKVIRELGDWNKRSKVRDCLRRFVLFSFASSLRGGISESELIRDSYEKIQNYDAFAS